MSDHDHTDNNSRFLTDSDLMAMFQCAPQTLRKWRSQGRLPYHRLGGLVRYTLEDVESFINASRVQATGRGGRHV